MTEIVEKKKHEYCKKTLEMEEGARMLYLLLGERLANIREERLYEPFWADWGTFCMEFKDLSPASISKIIKVYQLFVVKLGYSPEKLAKAGGWTKLYAISLHIKTKKDAEKWLALGESQSRQDLGKHLVEAKSGISMSDCKHKNTYVIRVCEDCGNREKVYSV